MIEYGVPLLFLFVLFVGVPVMLIVATFLVAYKATNWWWTRTIRKTTRIGMQERARINTYR